MLIWQEIFVNLPPTYRTHQPRVAVDFRVDPILSMGYYAPAHITMVVLNVFLLLAPRCWRNITVDVPSHFLAHILFQPLYVYGRRLGGDRLRSVGIQHISGTHASKSGSENFPRPSCLGASYGAEQMDVYLSPLAGVFVCKAVGLLSRSPRLVFIYIGHQQR